MMTSSRDEVDVIVVGGGHNGLVCAAYLARAGKSVTVVEARKRLGGPAGRFDFMPGFSTAITNSPGSLESTVIHELELERFGLKFFRPKATMIHPFPDETFVGWRERTAVDAQLDHYAPGEALRYRKLIESLNLLGSRLGVSLWKTPPDADSIRAGLTEPEDRQLFDQLVYGSLHELLESSVRSSQAKALLTMLAVNGQMVSPKQAGSAIGLLMRPISMASTNGQDANAPNREVLRGSVGLPIGSMSAIVDALRLSGKSYGANYITGQPVRRILTEDGVCKGVEFEEGSVLRGKAVVSTVEPSILNNELLNDADRLLPEGQKLEPPKGSAFKIALALDDLPNIRNLPAGISRESALASQIRIGPSPEYIEQSINDALAGRPSRSPIMWALMPTLTSPGLAPDGQHLLSINVWHAPHSLGPEYWAMEKEAFGIRCVEVLEDFLPGLSARITGHRFMDPTELATELNLTGSNITHGDMLPESLFGGRPHAKANNHENMVEGLFIGGSGAWPGGYVTGAPGRNASQKAHDYLTSERG